MGCSGDHGLHSQVLEITVGPGVRPKSPIEQSMGAIPNLALNHFDTLPDPARLR